MWNNTKQIVLRHVCPVHKILTGIWKPLISGQNVNSHLVRESVHLAVATSRLNKVMHVDNWGTDHLQHDLYVDISLTTLTAFKSQKILFNDRALGSNLLQPKRD